MEDPAAPNVVPTHDHQHDQVDSSLSFIDQMLMNMDGPDHDSFLWDPLLLSNDVINFDLDNPLNDPVFWRTPSQNDNYDHHRYEVGSTSNGCDIDIDGKKESGDQGMETGREALDNSGNQNDHDDDRDHQEDGLTMAPLQVWALNNNDNNPTVPDHSCSCCQVLREIIHTNGTHTTKFEIHGKVGLVSHAILENHYASNDGSASSIQDCQMLDFCRHSLENIKEYIKWYLEDHRQKGYTLLQEPLSFFYEVLCTGYNWVHSSESQAGTSNQGVNTPLEFSNYAVEVPPMANHQVPSVLRTELAVQRERIKNMTIGDFAKYFDSPIEEAAKQLRLCATVIKKKLRSYNISRWPYRKVRSMKRKISLWRKDLEVENPEARARAEIEIVKLQQQLADIVSGNIETLNNA